MGNSKRDISLKLMDIHERTKQSVMTHGGFEFSFIKVYAGEKKQDRGIFVHRGGGYGNMALSLSGVTALIKELKDLLAAYKKNYVEHGDDWRGYENTSWLSVVYNAQADVVTISQKDRASSFIDAVLLQRDSVLVDKLRCRIDDVPYIIDGLEQSKREYNKFYGE